MPLQIGQSFLVGIALVSRRLAPCHSLLPVRTIPVRHSRIKSSNRLARQHSVLLHKANEKTIVRVGRGEGTHLSLGGFFAVAALGVY